MNRQTAAYLGSIGGSYEDHLRLLVGTRPVQLHQELGFDASRCFVFICRSLAQQRVNLVDKDHRGLTVRRDGEQRPDRLLALTDPFAGEGRRTDAEECTPHLMRDGLSDQRLP